MAKVCLDAGHYGKYNQSPANKVYYESVCMWKLHLLQKKYLEEYGIEVITTRDNISTNTGLYQRGEMSRGCDLFISNHSNAVGSYVSESVDYPVAFVPLNGKGDDIGKKLTDCVHSVMGTVQGGRIATRKNSTGGEYYGVIRGAVAVGTIGMILEHSFHTNTRTTNWLLDENNLDKMAREEARVIAEYLGVAKDDVDTLKGWVTVIYKGDDGLNIRTAPKIEDNIKSVAREGNVYKVVGITENKKWYKLENGCYISANAIYVKFTANEPKIEPFTVKVEISDLNIRKGAGTDYAKTGKYTGKGTFTIVEVKEGKGSKTGWGKLKSGAGWISLDYAKRV